MPADARRAFLLHFCHVYAPYMYLLFDHLFPSNATPNTSGSGGATISTAAAHYLHVHHISRPLTVFGTALVCCIAMIVICAQNSNRSSKNCDDDNNDDNDNDCDSENDEVASGGFIYAAVCLLVVLLSKWFLAFGKAALFINAQVRTTSERECSTLLRCGGVGIQVGSLLGALLFFVLTVVIRVL